MSIMSPYGLTILTCSHTLAKTSIILVISSQQTLLGLSIFSMKRKRKRMEKEFEERRR